MNILYDNLTAALVMGALLMILLNVHHRNQEATLERESFYAMRRQQIAFVETLERDFNNAASFEATGMSAADSTFSFHAYLTPDNAAKRRVVYRLVKAGQEEGVTIYEVQRFEEEGGALVRRGGSMPKITRWKVEAQSSDGQPVADAAEARQYLVRFEARTPHAGGNDRPAVPIIRWESTFRPPAIRLNTRI